MRRRVLRVKLQALDFKTAQREGRAGEAYGSQRNGSKRTPATPTRLSIHSVEARRPAASLAAVGYTFLLPWLEQHGTVPLALSAPPTNKSLKLSYSSHPLGHSPANSSRPTSCTSLTRVPRTSSSLLTLPLAGRPWSRRPRHPCPYPRSGDHAAPPPSVSRSLVKPVEMPLAFGRPNERGVGSGLESREPDGLENEFVRGPTALNLSWASRAAFFGRGGGGSTYVFSIFRKDGDKQGAAIRPERGFVRKKLHEIELYRLLLIELQTSYIQYTVYIRVALVHPTPYTLIFYFLTVGGRGGGS